MSGVKEIREVVASATKLLETEDKKTIVFFDEIHRFNKSQQDALLPHVENGIITLIGATTENPSFEINSALLSRVRVLQLYPLNDSQVEQVINRAILYYKDKKDLVLEEDAKNLIVQLANGDARSTLNMLEAIFDYSSSESKVSVDIAREILQTKLFLYDKSGEEHYNLISALHKSIRNSDVNAGLYWLGRMLESGEDPLFLVRRLIRFASEDIGNADPQALVLAIAVKDTIQFVGMPESNNALAQLVIYLATAPKSNSVYVAYNKVKSDVVTKRAFPVPLHLRNAPTKLMKQFDYGKNYQYAHDMVDGIAAEMKCLPEELVGTRYYEPIERGFEREIKKRMDYWEKKNGAPSSSSAVGPAIKSNKSHIKLND